MRKLAIFPHNDDEALFMAYTLMREKPLVVIVTDAHIQANRGEIGCDSETRWEETKKAMDILGCPVMRLGIPDTDLLNHAGGLAISLHHDIVHDVCVRAFGNKLVEYTTYSKTELWTKGDIEVVPTPEELDLKNLALECYNSQINLPATRPHFEAVKGKSEWLNTKREKCTNCGGPLYMPTLLHNKYGWLCSHCIDKK